jgi:DNA-binding CsgD family transcriptional regulator
MRLCVEEFIEWSSQLTSAVELFDLYLGAIREAGYQNAIFARINDHRLVSIFWNYLPAHYLNRYIDGKWGVADPVIPRAYLARQPFRWNELRSDDSLTEEQRAFLDTSRELGVHSGITLPLHGPGTEVDIISLSLRDSRPLRDDRMLILHAISVQYWLKFKELAGERQNAVPSLTSKEIECLKWCKQGKTNWEIGEIVLTSEKTVQFHLSNAIRKLGASNRMTAVVAGLQAGLINL